jgi:hypothetical protein
MGTAHLGLPMDPSMSNATNALCAILAIAQIIRMHTSVNVLSVIQRLIHANVQQRWILVLARLKQQVTSANASQILLAQTTLRPTFVSVLRIVLVQLTPHRTFANVHPIVLAQPMLRRTNASLIRIALAPTMS